MPGFLISFLINMVLKFGIPWVIAFIKRRWGIDILPGDLQAIVEAHAAKQNELHQETKQKLKECTGVACPMDTKE